MSFRVSNTALTAFRAAKKPATTTRAFHSPFAVLGDGPLSATTPAAASAISAHYEKQYEPTPEPVASHGRYRTYVVSEPEPTSRHYQVPAGAYPTSAPYINFTATPAPDTTNVQYSSTSADILAHGFTTRAAPQHRRGVGESSAIRNASAPGEMGTRGGSNGGRTMMDKKGTTPGVGQLADRNPPPDGSAAEKFSKAGVEGAWKLRK
ncbi:unnamed protein product [Cyclocybe aegerita]|uniref:Uncharacterized protein n=1 Tax=Cyclocybe aegerita TaxID=1973307 RepID=A0A8S0XPZ6_CYCAE|nr:unnamed protein product [Cyclocybe aegerita]